jgi:hypothetical protein
MAANGKLQTSLLYQLLMKQGDEQRDMGKCCAAPGSVLWLVAQP